MASGRLSFKLLPISQPLAIMTNNPRLPQQIKIRVRLPLYGTAFGRADITIERLDGKTFELQPLRYRPKDGNNKSAVEWYLRCSAPVKARVEIQLVGDRIWQQNNLKVNYSEQLPLELGLGFASDDLYFIIQGYIAVPLTFYNDINKDQPLRELWITNDIQGISSLLVQPSGLYLQGILPDAFYLGEQRLPVTLRVPQTEEDRIQKDNAIANSFPGLNLLGKRFWTLAAQKFSGNLDAGTYVKNCADRVEKFRLPAADRRLDTFLDNVESQPGTNCIVQFFREDQKIDWIAQSLNTRMTIGGGTTAEASFQPQFLTGELQRLSGRNAPWTLTSIQFESAGTIANPPHPEPDIALILKKTDSVLGDEVKFSFRETLVQAISIPAVVLSDSKYRSWLCLAEGWLAIDSSDMRAEINLKTDTQGAVFGIVEIDKLLRGLQENSARNTADITATAVQVATLQQSRVAVKLSNEGGIEQLSLEFYNPMTTAIAPNVWFQAQPTDPAKKIESHPQFIPSLTAGTATTEINPESILKQRLVSAVFVSSNVVKPSPQGMPVVARISWKKPAFQFQFRHGTVPDNPDATKLQQLLLWNRPVGYPIVQSFPLSPVKDESAFLDTSRGLIPYQPQTETWIEIQFPERGLPRCLPKSPDLIDAAPWQIVTQLLTSRYFLPTLPGVELNLNRQPMEWIYRHSVPVLDEAYAEVSESESEVLTNAGNVEGRDFTRVVGTEAFTLVPAEKSRKAWGWLHKTTANKEGAIEISIIGDDATRLAQLKGPDPHFKFTLKNQPNPITFSRNIETSGGLTIPLQTNISTSSTTSLPEFKVNVANNTNEIARYRIFHNGQPLIAEFLNAQNQGVVTLDGEGLVQAETMGDYSTYRGLDFAENRRLTKSFALLPALHLEVIGVPLGEFSRTEDLYQQSWMLHDGNGGWAKLAGFPLYPLCLRKIAENEGKFNIIIEAVWLKATPLQDQPISGIGVVTLNFTGSESNWKLQVTGDIDWQFIAPEEASDSPRLARLQAELKPNQIGTSEAFELENLQLAIAHAVGLISLTSLSNASCAIAEGILRFEVPQTTQESFQFQIAPTEINVEQLLQPLDNYSFRWQDPTSDSDRILLQEALRLPGVAGQTIETIISLVKREADYLNEFGLFKVDDPQGRIGTLTPDNPKYAAAALSERQLAVFPANTQQLKVELPAAQWMGMYLIQNSTTSDFIRRNPENKLGKEPLAFFSFVAANPDKLSHLKTELTEQVARLSWEDREGAGDRDFNDLVVEIKFKLTNLVWDLELESRAKEPCWSLDIRRGQDLLVSLLLKQHRIGASKFIFATDANQNILPLGENSWFERLEADSGLLGIEFHISPQGLPTIKTMMADLQLRLTDKSDRATRLVLRLKLNLSHPRPAKQYEIEAAGQITLINAIRFQGCQHVARFYFDQADISESAAFKILSGEGPTETVLIGGIAHHQLKFNDGKTFYWQSPQIARFTTLEQFAKTFLGKTIVRPPEIVGFDSNQAEIETEKQIQLLNRVWQMLKQNPEDTADIEGHSDNRGNPQIKQKISEQRAASVRDWLIRNNIDASRLTTKGWSDSRPRGDNSTPSGRAQNRRVEIIIYTTTVPDIPSDKKSNLLIESGAVFEIREETSPTPKIVPPTADIENKFIRLFLRSRELQQLEAQPAHIVRLPLAACSQSDRDLTLWPQIQLQPTPPDLIYRTFGIQKQIKPPISSFNLQTKAFEIFYRTTQAQWLASAYLREAISDRETVELKPAFLEADRITLRLPEQLGDLEWLRNRNSSQLTAATLVTPYNLERDEVPVFDEPTLFEYPLTIEEVTNTEIAATVDVQLIVFSHNRLQRIARDRLKPDEDILQWANNILRGKRRNDGAVVLQNFEEIILIPRGLEAWREELNNIPTWELDRPSDRASAYGEEIDPRCRLPQIKPQPFAIKANPNLGLLLFDATPAHPENPQLKSVAATRFRLAPTGDFSTEFAGKLRPARITKIESKELFNFTKWEQVSFEQYQQRSQGEPLYPQVNPRPIVNRPYPIEALAKLEEGGATATTLLPPLIDVVAWSSRPGEMMRSLWYFNSLSSPSRANNQQLYQLAGSAGVSVSLRQPRAVAGRDESVSVSVETSYPLFNYQFYYARLLLTQILGNTPALQSGEIYPVLATKNDFYLFNTGNFSQAASSPALVYYNEKQPKEPEPMELYLLADAAFKPKDFDPDNPQKVTAKTLLLAVKPGATIPDLPDAQNSEVELLIADLAAPSQTNKSWNPLSDKIYHMQVPGLSEWATRYINSPNASTTANIVLVKYEFKQEENIWKPQSPKFVGCIAFLDRGNAIVAPKLGLALLALPKNKLKEQVVLSGYGRLNDDNFSPIKPLSATDNGIDWARTACLHALDCMDLEIASTAVEQQPPYLYDYDPVLYGSGGELIPKMKDG